MLERIEQIRLGTLIDTMMRAAGGDARVVCGPVREFAAVQQDSRNGGETDCRENGPRHAGLSCSGREGFERLAIICCSGVLSLLHLESTSRGRRQTHTDVTAVEAYVPQLPVAELAECEESCPELVTRDRGGHPAVNVATEAHQKDTDPSLGCWRSC